MIPADSIHSCVCFLEGKRVPLHCLFLHSTDVKGLDQRKSLWCQSRIYSSKSICFGPRKVTTRNLKQPKSPGCFCKYMVFFIKHFLSSYNSTVAMFLEHFIQYSFGNPFHCFGLWMNIVLPCSHANSMQTCNVTTVKKARISLVQPSHCFFFIVRWHDTILRFDVAD